MERETCTVDEAAERLGIGRALAFRLAKRGELPVLRLGRRLVVPEVGLRRMLGGARKPWGASSKRAKAPGP